MASCRLSAAFSASSPRFGFDGSTSSLRRKMSSAIIVASRYAIPPLDQYGPGFRHTQLLDKSPRWGTRGVDFGGGVGAQWLSKHGVPTSQQLKRHSPNYRFKGRSQSVIFHGERHRVANVRAA